MERIRNGLALLRGQLWIVPALMSAAALALAYAMLGSGSRISGGFTAATPERRATSSPPCSPA